MISCRDRNQGGGKRCLVVLVQVGATRVEFVKRQVLVALYLFI